MVHEHVTQREFRVMGTDAHVIIVDGPPRLGAFAERRLRDLEQRWSRFVPTSELSHINDHPGVPVVVSDDTFMAIQMAMHASTYTAGVFDPTVHDALVNAGYDRDFRELEEIASASTAAAPAPGCAGVHLDPIVRSVTVPHGVRLDLGGIGKGLAADFVARELANDGASGACVNLGGDLCAIGEPPEPAGWLIELTLPRPDALGGAHAILLPEGAVATSSVDSRRWRRNGRDVHHLIDPSTGEPTVGPIRLATAIAGDAWWAETCAKTMILTGSTEVAVQHGNAGLVALSDGRVECFGGFERFLISPDPH